MINSTSTPPQLIIKTPLDREKQELYNFDIEMIIYNKSKSVHMSYTLTLKVLDKNDNKPTAITRTVVVWCYEANSIITHVNATDPDQGNNGKINYTLKWLPHFNITNMGGILVLQKMTPNTTYSLNITLKDNGRPSLNSNVVITVVFPQIQNKTVEQYSPKGTNIAKVEGYTSTSCSLEITANVTENVITVNKTIGWITVNRLVTEKPDTKFCFAVKVQCPRLGARRVVYSIAVIAPSQTVSTVYISYSMNNIHLQLERKIKYEKDTDECIVKVNGSSRFFQYISVTLVIVRTFYSEADYNKITSHQTRNCLKRKFGSLESIQTDNPFAAATTSTPTTRSSALETTSGTRQQTTLPTTMYTTTTFPHPTIPKGETSEGGTNSLVTGLVAVLSTIVVVLIVVVVVYTVRRRMKKKQAQEQMEMTQIDGPKKPWREIDKGFIASGKELGSGYFGVVYQGTVILDGQSRHCAIKTLKVNATETDKRDLLNELDIMTRVGYHPNIINLIGACTTLDPPRVLLEFAANGNLLEYLQNHRNATYSNINQRGHEIDLDYKQRLKIAYEVAMGMKHLSSKKCVHRDLAARNVLLDENFVAKVTDFGLSRDVYEEGVYQVNAQTKMPLKWMAIESLESMEFTTQSDVWSFGVLVWEIETGGTTPYPGILGRELFQEILTGYRLEKPEKTPDELFEIMSKCWSRDPQSRPTFQDLCVQLGEILQFEAGYEDLLVAMENEETSETNNTQM